MAEDDGCISTELVHRKRAERAAEEIARLHEANDGWREKVAQVERELLNYRLFVASQVEILKRLLGTPFTHSDEYRRMIQFVFKNLGGEAQEIGES